MADNEASKTGSGGGSGNKLGSVSNSPSHVFMILTFVCLLLLVNINKLGHAASFDCKKAKSVMEKTICSDAQLSKLDEEINRKYSQIKKELKTRPNELNKIIEDQKDWLRNLMPSKKSKSPCAARVECLQNNFIVRNKELQFALAKARAMAPSEDVVIKKLSLQLEYLKNIAQKKYKTKIYDRNSDRSSKDNCSAIWENIQKTTVPIPTVFAGTEQQKSNLYEQLRDNALRKRSVYQTTIYKKKKLTLYTKAFDRIWDKKIGYKMLGAFNANRNDFVLLKFDTKETQQNPVLSAILLDIEGDGLSLSQERLQDDGLFSGRTSFSEEYHYEYRLDQPQNLIAPPHQKAGLLLYGDEVLLWQLDEGADMRPDTLYIDNGADISCTVNFKAIKSIK